MVRFTLPGSRRWQYGLAAALCLAATFAVVRALDRQRSAPELDRLESEHAQPAQTLAQLEARPPAYPVHWHMRRLRQLGNRHFFTLCCRDLSEISKYARVDNRNYRFLKRHTPGPFTFLLPATREAPRRLVHPKRKTTGLRVPNNPIALGLIEALGEPMMTTTMRLPGQEEPFTDADAIREALEHRVDLILDGGHAGTEPTTVIDLNSDPPTVVREGAGQLQ